MKETGMAKLLTHIRFIAAALALATGSTALAKRHATKSATAQPAATAHATRAPPIQRPARIRGSYPGPAAPSYFAQSRRL